MAVSNIKCLAMACKKNLIRVPALPKYLPAAVNNATRHLSDRPFQVAKTMRTLRDWKFVLTQCANSSPTLEGKQPQLGGSYTLYP